MANRLVSDPKRLVATIEASFPCPQKMEQAFDFATHLFQIRIPEALEMQSTNVVEHLAVVRAREEVAQKAASQISQEVESFVSDCVASLREQTATLCEEMLESMQSGKVGVHQKTLNRLVRFVDEFKKLNFVGDREMEEQLERVRQEFLSRTAEQYRDDANSKARLEAGLRGLADSARELMKQDAREIVERFGQMGQRKFHLAA